MNWRPRLALPGDVPAIRELIPKSSFHLQSEAYQPEQIESAIGPVFGVDKQLIADGTYFVVEHESQLIGCGGWSFRRSLFGGRDSDSVAAVLDPENEPARIRAFFVDPGFARQGIGSVIMRKCEAALVRSGFLRGEISATLAGEPLYEKFGYSTIEKYEIPLSGRLTLPVVRMTKQYSGVA